MSCAAPESVSQRMAAEADRFRQLTAPQAHAMRLQLTCGPYICARCIIGRGQRDPAGGRPGRARIYILQQ